jgi:uncharacterized damage-inducible protein DinB
METTQQIANRFRDVILNGTWIANTNYKAQVLNTTWQQATSKVGTLNTIAALTFHINYYITGVLNVFKGGALDIKDANSFDCPTITSENDWQHLKNTLITNAEHFASNLEQMPNDTLDHVFVDEKYGNYRRNINAMIEHSYYHLGQITLIKKLLTTEK